MQLTCGDCLEVMKSIPDKSIDMILCDLPYYCVVKDDFDNQWKNENDYLEWVSSNIKRSVALLKEGGSFVLFCSRQMVHKIAIICESLGLIEQRMIIWCRKRSFNQTRGKALNSGYEPILYFTNGNQNITFNNVKIKVDSQRPEYKSGILKDGVSLSDCWTDIPSLPHNSKEKVKHPTQKPIKLMERIISIVSSPNDVILDFCMGSGTTGVACVNTGRDFIGIEKDEHYFEIAYNRINQTLSNHTLFTKE